METISRYDIFATRDGDLEAEVSQNGGWVKFEDILPLLEKVLGIETLKKQYLIDLLTHAPQKFTNEELDFLVDEYHQIIVGGNGWKRLSPKGWEKLKQVNPAGVMYYCGDTLTEEEAKWCAFQNPQTALHTITEKLSNETILWCCKQVPNYPIIIKSLIGWDNVRYQKYQDTLKRVGLG